MRRLVLALCLCLLCSGLALAAEAPKDPRKHTRAGKYLTSMEAYQMWKAAPQSTFVIDVRSPAEYDLLGHPAMAANVPLAFWTGAYDPARNAYLQQPNRNFAQDVRRLRKPGDRLLVICRSGHRSAVAADLLTEAGFTDVYSVIDGFEGDRIADRASPDFGKRLQEGWRNAKLPWTTDLDPRLVYQPGK